MALHQSNPIWGKIIKLTYIRNADGVFGISLGPLSGNWFAIASILLLLILVLIYRRSIRESLLMGTAFAFIIGGALGNLLDRIRFGDVVDFIDMGFPNGPRWPIYNIADLAVVLGMILMVIYFIREERLAVAAHEQARTQPDNSSS